MKPFLRGRKRLIRNQIEKFAICVAQKKQDQDSYKTQRGQDCLFRSQRSQSVIKIKFQIRSGISNKIQNS